MTYFDILAYAYLNNAEWLSLYLYSDNDKSAILFFLLKYSDIETYLHFFRHERAPE
jgi:hypothetical protein